MKCHLGMFMLLSAYFTVFVSASSLLVLTKIGATKLFLYHVSLISFMCM